MKRPFVPAVIFYISGVLLGRYLTAPNIAIYIAVFFGAVVTAGLFNIKTGRYEWLIILPLLAVGLFTINTQTGRLFQNLNGMKISVRGAVTNIQTTDYGYETITLNFNEIREGSNLIKHKKKVNIYFKEPQNLMYGQAITVEGKAESLSFKRNPGGFSEQMYMLTRGIIGKITEPSITARGQIENIYAYYIDSFTSRVALSFAQKLPEEMAALMSAMVLGDRTSISAEGYDAFQKTGVAHIFSISGLHISFICLLLNKTLRKVGLGISASSLATIVVMLAYAYMTGLSVSTVRAVLVIGVLLFGNIIWRTPDTLNSIAFSALIILLQQPLFLWDAGFLLSFSAVLGIAFLNKPIMNALAFMDRGEVRLSQYISVTLAATIFTLPVTTYFFSYASVVGVFVNMLIVPFAGILTALGLSYIFLGTMFISTIIAAVMFTILQYFIAVTQFFAELPFATVTTGQPSLYNIAAYYIITMLTYLYFLHGKQYKPMIRKAFAAVITVFAIINAAVRFVNRDIFELAFLDVNQGDCTILHFPGNIDIMVDGGGSLLADIGRNTGARIVYPYLLNKGKNQLNAVFLTHPDIDHAAGVIEIMKLMKVRRLFVPACNFGDDAVMALVLKTAEENNVPVSRIKSGYKAQIGDTKIECLYPNYGGMPKNVNNGSLVLKVTYKARSFLITGDIEKNDEERLVVSQTNMKSDILKVPHHGSKTSSTIEFVEAVSPETAIVGSGRDNNFSHPSKETIETFGRLNIPMLTTAEEGAISIKTDGESFKLTTMREAGYAH